MTAPDAPSLSPLLGGEEALEVKKLHGDGSARAFYRVRTPVRTHVLLAGPDARENAAYVRIARHLAARGVRVPEVRAFDEGRGWILLEDLGDESLYSVLRNSPEDTAARIELYEPVIPLLVRMQLDGAKGFGLSTGFADAPYGPALMVEHEAFYFVREFAEGVLGLAADHAALGAEFARMAERAAAAPGGYFLHRDFQSRNLHRVADGWAVIDFQGARPGPLAYDAAALILDPYAALSEEVRKALWKRYFAELSRRGEDAGRVEESLPWIGTFRLMQALGAFGKLGGRLGKPGFLEHADAALARLGELLETLGPARPPVLSGLVARAREARRC